MSSIENQKLLNLPDAIMKIHANHHGIEQAQENEDVSARHKRLGLSNLLRVLLLKNLAQDIYSTHATSQEKRRIFKNIHQLMTRLAVFHFREKIKMDAQEMDENQENEQAREEEMQELDRMQKDSFQKMVEMLDEIENQNEPDDELYAGKEQMLELLKISPECILDNCQKSTQTLTNAHYKRFNV